MIQAFKYRDSNESDVFILDQGAEHFKLDNNLTFGGSLRGLSKTNEAR